MHKQWILPAPDKALATELAEQCGIDPLTALILSSRGVTDPVDIEEFLSDEIMLSDPYDFIDMDKAVMRIKKAIDDFERIAIYGDYDCDGVTSTALLYHYLNAQSADVMFYIPDRSEDGYGMNRNSVDKLKEQGVSLIVTVDNGVSAVDETAYAKELGMDVVITDHHLPKEVLPDACAVVDPHRADCPSSYKSYAGVGVVFQLVCGLAGKSAEEMLCDYADLVALGTITDVMPLKGENRILVKAGLRNINETSRTGITALTAVAGLSDKKIKAGNIAFGIGPRINAAGRMGLAERAVRLLLSEDDEAAADLAAEVDSENARRQQIEHQIVIEACGQIDRYYEFDRVLVVSGTGWHTGIAGIVAARLMERYGKPCIVFSVDGDKAVGSGRSLRGFSLYNAIDSAKHICLRYGGHELAAGLTVPADKVGELREAVNRFAREKYDDMPFPQVKLDCKLNPAALSIDLVASLDDLAPFGSGNPSPVFGLYSMKIENIQSLSGGKHSKLYFSRNDATIQAMMFGTTPADICFGTGDTVDLAVSLETSVWQGSPSLTIQVKAIRAAGEDESLFSQIRLYEKCRRNTSDELITKEQVLLLLPSREETAVVYRALRSYGCESVSLNLFESKLHGKIAYGKMRIALDALAELKLLSLSKESGNTTIALESAPDKVDLDSAAILQRLREI